MRVIEADMLRKWFVRFLQQFPGHGLKTPVDWIAKVKLVDLSYGGVSEDDIDAVLQGSPMMVPIGDLYDCDDYALRFKVAMTSLILQRAVADQVHLPPPAIGVLVTQSHALNIVLVQDGDDDAPEFRIGVVDPGNSNVRQFVAEPADVARMIGTLPVEFVYV